MPEAVWQVQVEGRASDLEYLARTFASGSLRIVKDDRDGCFLLQHEDFQSLATSDAVLAEADAQLSIINGVLKLERQSDDPLRSGAVYRKHSDGRRDAFVHVHEVLTARAEFEAGSVTVTDSNGVVREQPPSKPRSVKVVELAMFDAAVAKALRLLGSDPTSWVGLYRLHEVIEADVGNEHTLAQRGWGLPGQLKRFKHSANSVAVGGDTSRHGKEKKLPPSDPMALDEAEVYVNAVLHAWLSSKGA